MYQAIRRVLARPGEYFERDGLSSTRSVAIVVFLAFVSVGLLPAIIALLRAWSDIFPGILEVLPLVEYASGESAVAVPGIFLFSAAMMVLFPLIAWVAYTLVFHALSWPVATEGSIRRTHVFVAWGFLPQLVASLVTLAGVALTFPGSANRLWSLGVTFPARTYAMQADPGPILFTTNAVGALCTLWSAYIWMHALATARGMTRRQAAGVVAGPILLTLAITPPLSSIWFSLFV